MFVVSAMYLLIPDLFLFGFFTGEPTQSGEKVRAIAIVLLRYVAAYNLFDALNMVFVNAIKGAGDTRFVFLTSFWMAVALGVGTWVAQPARCRTARMLGLGNGLDLGLGHGLPGEISPRVVARNAGLETTPPGETTGA